jgi:hypothetical protein
MSIFRKSYVEEPIQTLDRYYQELRTILIGNTPNGSAAHRYGFEDRDQFSEEFTEINVDKLLKAIEHFKVEVASLKTLKNKAQSLPK